MPCFFCSLMLRLAGLPAHRREGARVCCVELPTLVYWLSLLGTMMRFHDASGGMEGSSSTPSAFSLQTFWLPGGASYVKAGCMRQTITTAIMAQTAPGTLTTFIPGTKCVLIATTSSTSGTPAPNSAYRVYPSVWPADFVWRACVWRHCWTVIHNSLPSRSVSSMLWRTRIMSVEGKDSAASPATIKGTPSNRLPRRSRYTSTPNTRGSRVFTDASTPAIPVVTARASRLKNTSPADEHQVLEPQRRGKCLRAKGMRSEIKEEQGPAAGAQEQEERIHRVGTGTDAEAEQAQPHHGHQSPANPGTSQEGSLVLAVICLQSCQHHS